MSLFHCNNSPTSRLWVGLTQASGLMRHTLAIALALIAGSALAADPAIADAELSVGGVALGASESEVLSILGPAPKQTETGEGTALEYPDITVLIGWLEQKAAGKERRVIQLTGYGTSACTPAGVCPGVTVAQAVAAYGQPTVANRETGRFLEFYSDQSSCWLQLAASANIVRSVSAVCQP